MALLLGAGSVRADLIVNGGFETGDFNGWDVNVLVYGNPSRPGDAAKVASSIGSTPVAHSGMYGAAFGPGSDVDMSQSVDVPSDGSYVIDFWFQQNQNDDSYLTVSLGTSILQSYVFTTNFAYTEFAIPMVASAGPQTLDFSVDVGNTNGPVFMDDISMNADVSTVPEPSTVIAAMLVLVPSGLGTIRQLRQKMRA